MNEHKYNQALVTPLIKWPGGKSKEFQYFSELIPKFKRYIEPFFGGGGVFFRLQPSCALINDKCDELAQFYRYIRGEEGGKLFAQNLREYVSIWREAGEISKLSMIMLKNIYFSIDASSPDEAAVVEKIDKYFFKNKSLFESLSDRKICLNPDALREEIKNSLYEKLLRTAKLELEKGKISDEDLEKNIETGIRGGVYMYFRGLMNELRKCNLKHLPLKIANYYFVREFCYGSMFRFNSSGDFNIPYGGIAYNDKDFSGKVEHLLSKEVHGLFKNTEVGSEDFETFLFKAKTSADDFIFLDPPYDTDFSAYENSEFGKSDQERLAKLLLNTEAKFMLVIKNTPFIYSLYDGKKGINIATFDKKYLYNVRGRNERQVEHLIIFNYEAPQRVLL
jgi:DNA adenine methylase